MSEQAVIDRVGGDEEFQRQRAAKRAAFPSVTAIVDEFRAVFGDGVRALGGEDLVTGRSTGWVQPPHPNCDACTGHDGSDGCDRMDYIAHGHDKPEPGKVFCAYRLKHAPVLDDETKGKRR